MNNKAFQLINALTFFCLYKRKLQRKVHPAEKSNFSNIKAKIEEFVNSLTLRHTNSVIICFNVFDYSFDFSKRVPKGK